MTEFFHEIVKAEMFSKYSVFTILSAFGGLVPIMILAWIVGLLLSVFPVRQRVGWLAIWWMVPFTCALGCINIVAFVYQQRAAIEVPQLRRAIASLAAPMYCAFHVVALCICIQIVKAIFAMFGKRRDLRPEALRESDG